MSLTVNRRGVTRIVLLTDRHAIKLPNFTRWRLFLHGLCANLRERTDWAPTRDPRLCPMCWSLPGGWCNVMRRARPLTDAEWATTKRDRRAWDGLPTDWKRENFGVLGGRAVLVDYG